MSCVPVIVSWLSVCFRIYEVVVVVAAVVELLKVSMVCRLGLSSVVAPLLRVGFPVGFGRGFLSLCVVSCSIIDVVVSGFTVVFGLFCFFCIVGWLSCLPSKVHSSSYLCSFFYAGEFVISILYRLTAASSISVANLF